MFDKRQIKVDNSETGSISGYLVTWGDKDNLDSQGEYFTPNTDFGLIHLNSYPVLYYMPYDYEPIDSVDISHRAARLGTLDNIISDDTGLFAEATIDLKIARTNEILFAIDHGAFYWAISTADHLVTVEDDGRVTQWIIISGNLTKLPV